MHKQIVGLVVQVGQKSLCVFLISTYTDGDPPQSASWFYKWLGESALDFRVAKTILQGLHFAVVALGSSAYQPDAFCKVSLKYICGGSLLNIRLSVNIIIIWIPFFCCFEFRIFCSHQIASVYTASVNKYRQFLRVWVESLQARGHCPVINSTNLRSDL